MACIICVEDRGHDKDLLLGDAQQVVVVGGSGNDRASGAIQIGRLVDDDRRITGTGDDGTFAGIRVRRGPRRVRP